MLKFWKDEIYPPLLQESHSQCYRKVINSAFLFLNMCKIFTLGSDVGVNTQ